MSEKPKYEELERRIRELEKIISEYKRPIKVMQDSEERFRKLYEQAPLGYQSLDLEGRFVEVNKAWLDLMGYSRSEVLGHWFGEFLVQHEVEPYKKRFLGFISAGEFHTDVQMLKSDGSEITVHIDGRIGYDERGKFNQTHCILYDITARKQAEWPLRESEEKYRNLFNNAEVGMFITKLDGSEILDMNDKFIGIFGQTREEMLNKPSVNYWADPLERQEMVRRLEAEGCVTNFECGMLNKRGEARLCLTSLKIYREQGILEGSIMDITDRKRAEDALRESEEKYRRLFELESDAIFLIENDTGKILEANISASNIYGFGREELLRMKNVDLSAEVDKTKQATQNQLTQIPIRYHRKKNGTVFPVEITASHLNWKGREAHIATIRDITFRIEAESVLRESEGKYRSMMESMKDQIYICSPEFRIGYMNPAMIARVGRDASGELCYNAIYDRDEKCSWCGFDQIEQKKYVEYEVADPKNNRYYSVTNSPVSHADGTVSKLTIFHDITETKTLGEHLRQSQKMEAIGTLAGGIAHDFNNILSAIFGYTELALMKIDTETEIKADLKEVLTAAERAKDLVRQILAFSRQTQKEQMPVQVGLIAKEALKLLRSSLPATIDIRQNILSKSIVQSDPTQLHQIVMNLCTNAAHAMQEKGGILKVTLTDVALDPDFCASHLEIQPGAYLKLSVSDTGHGITPEVINRIFDPFFTTKPKDQGTGLGLSVVHGIVKDCGGTITVYSEMDKGTIFNLYLPIIKGRVVEKPEEQTIIPTGTERILVVDDEKAIIEIIQKILKSLGYAVEARTSSLEALELFKAMHSKFDLVITDMTMPQMTGDTLGRELMKIRPDIPVILCTGFSENITREKAETMGIKAFLMKPLLKEEMAHTIRKVLDEAK